MATPICQNCYEKENMRIPMTKRGDEYYCLRCGRRVPRDSR